MTTCWKSSRDLCRYIIARIVYGQRKRITDVVMYCTAAYTRERNPTRDGE